MLSPAVQRVPRSHTVAVILRVLGSPTVGATSDTIDVPTLRGGVGHPTCFDSQSRPTSQRMEIGGVFFDERGGDPWFYIICKNIRHAVGRRQRARVSKE